jgi:hypothetical protein
MNSDQKILILRYAQLVFAKELKISNGNDGFDTDLEMQLDALRNTLDMSHEAIMEHASRNLIEDFDC